MNTIGENRFEKTCYFWNKYGECKHGEKCHYLHRKTAIVADPPAAWVDYGDRGPPPKNVNPTRNSSIRDDSTRDGSTRDGSEAGGNRGYNHQNSVEEEWESNTPAGEWNKPSSPNGASNWQQPTPARAVDEWEQSSSNLVDVWYPPTPKANGARSIAASTVASGGPAAPGPSTVYDDNPEAIGDIWGILLPPDFTKYAALRQKYATTDPEFEVDTLVVYLSANPFQLSDVEQYLNGYSEREVGLGVNKHTSYEKLTAIFFAVATNEPRALKLLINKGADVNSTAGMDGIPVLAFTIMHGSKENTTEIVRILLAHGADPTVIPEEFISLDKHSLNNGRGLPGTPPNAISTQWCSEKYRTKLASTINITQRYWLAKARGLRPRTPRELMVARKEKCQDLFQIPYSLVGQDFATGFLMRRILSHIMLSKSGTKPLVVTFVGEFTMYIIATAPWGLTFEYSFLNPGPSGHGKTELARSMRSLLSAAFLAIDCTELSHTTDLFGPKAPFPGYEEGSALNNFLCRSHGQRSIVFLDDFEKMGPAVHESLLIPFGEGRYHDRRTARNDAEIDCSKVIWILATSKVDNIIEPYYRANAEIFQTPGPQDKQAVMNVMQNIEVKFLRKFSTQFGTTFAGRISMVLPFLPFSPVEQAVIAHKYILELKNQLAADIDVDKDAIMGHIKLEVEGEPAVCRIMAENGYDVEYGARSIEREVQKTVHDAITQEWLESSDEVTNQKNNGAYERYGLSVHSSGEYVHVSKLVERKNKGRAKQNGYVRKLNGSSRLGSSSGGRSGTPSSVGGVRQPVMKVGRLIDIGGGEMVKEGWEE